MTYYDDHTLSCPRCATGLEADDLCECDDITGPLCISRCCSIEHGRNGRRAVA